MKSAFAYIAQRVVCDGSEVRRTEEAIPGSLETLTERFPVISVEEMIPLCRILLFRPMESKDAYKCWLDRPRD